MLHRKHDSRRGVFVERSDGASEGGGSIERWMGEGNNGGEFQSVIGRDDNVTILINHREGSWQCPRHI